MKKLFLIILIGLLAPTLVARAFSLSPLRQVVAVDPGQTVELAFTLSNSESKIAELEPAVVGLKADDQGRPVYDNTAEIINWVKPDWNLISLEEGAQEKVNFFINIPVGTYPGDYYLGVGAKHATVSGSAVSVGEQLLVVVNLKVSGQAHEDLMVDSWQNAGASIYSKDKKFDLRITNRGNVEMPLSAVLKITDWRENALVEKSVNIGEKILPLASRVASVKHDISGLRFGFYRANLTINYGLTNQETTVAESFWYVPMWMLAVGVLILLLMLAVFIKNRDFPNV